MQNNLYLKNVIFNQLAPHTSDNINLINAFSFVDRNYFLPQSKYNLSYSDSFFKVLDNIWQINTYSFSKILKLLSITEENNVLEIGSGSGINSIILSKISNRVHSVSSSKNIVNKAELFCATNQIRNCTFSDKINNSIKYNKVIINGYSNNNDFLIDKISETLSKKCEIVIFQPIDNNQNEIKLCNMMLLNKANNFNKEIKDTIFISPLENVII